MILLLQLAASGDMAPLLVDLLITVLYDTGPAVRQAAALDMDAPKLDRLSEASRRAIRD